MFLEPWACLRQQSSAPEMPSILSAGCGSTAGGCGLNRRPHPLPLPHRYMVVVHTADRNVHSNGQIISVYAN